MNLRTLSIALILVYTLLAAFAALNWPEMAAPVALSLGVVKVSAPLGVSMLGFIAIVSGLFILYIGVQQAGVILESRRSAKQMDAQRKLAEDAEASRFIELRTLLANELRNIEERDVDATRKLLERIDQASLGVHGKLEEATQTVSAHLGEIEDKLDRKLAS